MQQATDFREESLTLKALIKDLDDAAFEAVTQFKDWTINDVFRHLHFWNRAVMVASQGKRPLVNSSKAWVLTWLRAVRYLSTKSSI